MGKGKPPAFWTDEVDMEPFMKLKARDLVKTPLGLVVTVLGVKYETKQRGEIGTGELWVEYPNRFLAPLEKDMTGYTRLSDGMHLWRDLAEMNAIKEGEEAIRSLVDDDNALYAAELIAADKKKNQGKGKGKGKKK